jgi:hypothetical protein
MLPPPNTEIHETEISTFWFDSSGILYSLSKSPTRTIENTRQNFELVKRISKNKKICHLTFLSKSGIPDKQTRTYVTSELPNVYKAMALVSKSGLGKVIMNILFGLKPPVLPMKTFSTEAKAKEWLKQYL